MSVVARSTARPGGWERGWGDHSGSHGGWANVGISTPCGVNEVGAFVLAVSCQQVYCLQKSEALPFRAVVRSASTALQLFPGRDNQLTDLGPPTPAVFIISTQTSLVPRWSPVWWVGLLTKNIYLHGEEPAPLTADSLQPGAGSVGAEWPMTSVAASFGFSRPGGGGRQHHLEAGNARSQAPPGGILQTGPQRVHVPVSV